MENIDRQTLYIAGEFVGFVEGITEMADSSGLCDIPDGVAYSKSFMVVGKYLEDHPEELHLRPHELAIKALTEAFPIKK